MKRTGSENPFAGTAFKGACAGALVLLVLFTIFNQSSLAGPLARHWWTDLGWTISSLAAGLLCLNVSRRTNPPYQKAWFWVALGCLSWMAGMLVWDFYELVMGLITPFPSLADAGYSAFNLFLLAGGLALNYHRSGRFERAKLFVDSLIMMNVLALALGVVFYDSLIQSGTSFTGKMTALFYPVTALSACFLLAIVRAEIPTGTERQAWTWVLAGAVLNAAADTGYLIPIITGGYEVGSRLDPLWTGAFFCIGLGAIRILWSRSDSILEGAHGA